MDARPPRFWSYFFSSLSSFVTAPDAAIISQFKRQIPDAPGVRAWAITKSDTEWKERRDQIERYRTLEQ